MDIEISLIIPAYNEELRIERTIISYITKFKEHFKNFEIIIVLNGCRDNTLEVVKEIKKKYPDNVKYENFEEAIGKGGAIIEGLKKSRGEVVGFVDADEAFDANEIIKLIHGLESTDCVIASKWKDKSFTQVTEPFTRKFFSRGWNLLVRTSLGLKFKDTQAGAKFFKKEVKESMGYDFICKHFAFDAELLLKIKEKGFEIREVYTPSKHMAGSTFKMKHSFKMFTDLVKVWRAKH